MESCRGDVADRLDVREGEAVSAVGDIEYAAIRRLYRDSRRDLARTVSLVSVVGVLQQFIHDAVAVLTADQFAELPDAVVDLLIATDGQRRRIQLLVEDVSQFRCGKIDP